MSLRPNFLQAKRSRAIRTARLLHGKITGRFSAHQIFPVMATEVRPRTRPGRPYKADATPMVAAELARAVVGQYIDSLMVALAAYQN